GRERHFDLAARALCTELIPHLANVIGNVCVVLHAHQLVEVCEWMLYLLVHDLKSPLSVISCNLEALEDSELSDADRIDATNNTKTTITHLLSMIVDLLDIAKAEEGRLPFHPEPVNLASLLDDALGGYSRAIKQI